MYVSHRNMEEMWNVLQRGECPVADLVCNHSSFAQTVENLFTLAFLVSVCVWLAGTVLVHQTLSCSKGFSAESTHAWL